MDFTREQEIATVGMGRPHVVLVGAGASRAALPQGDANGKPLPLMNDFVEVLGLHDLLERAGIRFVGRNFEDLYADLHANNDHDDVRLELEARVYDFFRALELPQSPTIYDYMLLCLREKDVVATFNWDPFLLQAWWRNGRTFGLPRLLFLHGNVLVAGCVTDKVMGVRGKPCSKCGRPLARISHRGGR